MPSSEVEHQIQAQSLIARLDADIPRLAVRPLLLDRLERANGRDIEQERDVAIGELRHGILYTPGGFLGSKDVIEDAVVAGINRKRSGIAFQSGPIHIDMISFELRITEVLIALAGNGVVIVFVPDAVMGARDAILPHPVRAASQPLHAGAILLRIRESQP